MSAADSMRTLLLSELPFFASYFESLSRSPDRDGVRSFAAAMRHDTIHLQEVLRKSEPRQLAESIETEDIIKEILKLLDRWLDSSVMTEWKRKQVRPIRCRTPEWFLADMAVKDIHC